MLEHLVTAFGLVLEPATLVTILVSSLFGFALGATPGLTATMAVALIIPFTYILGPVQAIAAIISAAAAAISGGDVPNTLLRMPGTPASAAYVDEAFAMTRKGESDRALGISALCSMIGGVFGTIVLVLASPLLANFALAFSGYEFFWLGCLGLSCAVFASGDDILKGMASLMIGLLISTVGMDYSSGYPRFTMGFTVLLSGVSFIPAIIGMFALPEIFRSLLSITQVPNVPKGDLRQVWKRVFRSVGRRWFLVLRSSGLGTFIGALPGAGADIAAWISFALTRRLSKKPEKWGKGCVDGIVSGTSSNNAALGGAWIPAFVFAIPGDTITAIAIGVLYLKGLNPGPSIFILHADLMYAVFISFLFANLLILPYGFLATILSRYILRIPRDLIMPTLFVVASIGSFAINSDPSSIVIMFVVGVIAFILESATLPLAPVVLGIVLGKIVEQYLIRSIISSEGNIFAFVERPISAVLAIIVISIWLVPLIRMFLHRKPAQTP